MWGNSLQTWQHVVSRLWIIHRAPVAWEFSEVPCFRLRALLRASLWKPGRKVTFTIETQINSRSTAAIKLSICVSGARRWLYTVRICCQKHLSSPKEDRPAELSAEAPDLLSHILAKPLSSTPPFFFFNIPSQTGYGFLLQVIHLPPAPPIEQKIEVVRRWKYSNMKNSHMGGAAS